MRDFLLHSSKSRVCHAILLFFGKNACNVHHDTAARYRDDLTRHVLANMSDSFFAGLKIDRNGIRFRNRVDALVLLELRTMRNNRTQKKKKENERIRKMFAEATSAMERGDDNAHAQCFRQVKQLEDNLRKWLQEGQPELLRKVS